MFRVGDEVICVEAGALPCISFPYIRWGRGLRKGATYTVVAIAGPPKLTDGWAVQLRELGHREDRYFWGYRTTRFRKVEKRTETRNLTEWLAQPSKLDEEQSFPAPGKKEREKAQ